MDTKIFTTKEDYLEAVCDLLKNGSVVALPTETVYGLAADALNSSAVEKIFKAKNRPCDNPLIVHISKKEDLEKLVTEIPEKAQKCIDAFWPGPFTVILNKRDIVPSVTSGGLPTVAVRMPSNKIIAEIIEKSGIFLAAPSANLSGKPSPTKASHVIEDMTGKISAILDGGDCAVGLESTVVSFINERPVLLRPGFITAEQIKAVCPDLIIDEGVTKTVENDKALSPGMKYKHYAPKCDLTLINADSDAFCKYANILNIPVICFDEDKEKLTVPFISLESKPHAKLFSALRELDERGFKKAFIHSPEKSGVGLALYNRMVRSCGFKEITLPFIIGLTGPSGVGKTTLSEKAKEFGFFTVDCDKVAHLVVPTLKKELTAAFGEDIYNGDELNRPLLAKRAFVSADNTKKLNAITLGPITEKIKEIIIEAKNPLILLDGATIIESGINKNCSATISLLADEELRIERFKRRDNLSDEAAAIRALAKKDDDFYIKNSDYILYNNQDVIKLCDEFENIVNNLLKGE